MRYGWVLMVPGWFFMVWGRFSWFFMVLGSWLVFHGSSLVFMVFHGSRSVFNGSRSVFHGSRSFFMVPSWFSWFFMVPGWFFMVFHGFSPICTCPNCILARRSNLGPPPPLVMIIGKRMNLTPDLLLLLLGLCLSRSCNDPALGTTQGLIASGDHHREAKERCCHQGERKRPRHVQDQRLQRDR